MAYRTFGQVGSSASMLLLIANVLAAGSHLPVAQSTDATTVPPACVYDNPRWSEYPTKLFVKPCASGDRTQDWSGSTLHGDGSASALTNAGSPPGTCLGDVANLPQMEPCSASTKFVYNSDHSLSLSPAARRTQSGAADVAGDTSAATQCITVDNLEPAGNQKYQQFYQQMPKENNVYIKELSATLQGCEDACDGNASCIGFTRGASVAHSKTTTRISRIGLTLILRGSEKVVCDSWQLHAGKLRSRYICNCERVVYLLLVCAHVDPLTGSTAIGELLPQTWRGCAPTPTHSGCSTHRRV